jgi:hypothetical protein
LNLTASRWRHGEPAADSASATLRSYRMGSQAEGDRKKLGVAPFGVFEQILARNRKTIIVGDVYKGQRSHPFRLIHCSFGTCLSNFAQMKKHFLELAMEYSLWDGAASRKTRLLYCQSSSA